MTPKWHLGSQHGALGPGGIGYLAKQMQAENQLEVGASRAPLVDRKLRAGHTIAVKTPLGVWWAGLLAGVVLAAINACAISWWIPESRITASVRFQHYWFDVAQQLGLAWLLAAAVPAYHRLLKPLVFRLATWKQRRWLAPWLPWAALSGGLFVLLWPTLAQDFEEFAHRRATLETAPYLAWGMATACAFALAFALVLLTRWWRSWLAALAASFSAVVLIANHGVLENNYPGVHFLLTLGGLTGLIAACKPWRHTLPALQRWERWQRVGVPLLCLPAFISTPSLTLRGEQMKVHGSVVAPRLGQLKAWFGHTLGVALEHDDDWVLRTERTPVAASHPKLLPTPPLVILITIDAVRADVFDNPEHARHMRTLHQLREQSVYFDNARAPGSQTVTSLSAIFSGLYFSQQYWTRHPEMGHLFLGDDEPERFPQILQRAGIKTVTYSATYFLLNRFGIVRGFDEERFLDNPGQPLSAYSPGAQITNALLQAIERHGETALFLYAHYLDTHFPYAMGGRQGTPFERYLKAIGYVDRQLGRLLQVLEQRGLLERTLLVIASDHGEAFGEHNSKFHATTLYEEQLRVPLMFRMPSAEAKVVSDPVSLMDLGPTLLDLLGQTTPAHFMGQSLVPLLRGQPLRLTRPLVAEGRLKKALYFEDGYKLIVDDRNHTVELYDLRNDPRELENLIDAPEARGAERLEELREFFENHRIRRSGYQIPYRP